MIEGAADGFGTPIGSHYVPGALGYVDTTGVNPFNIEKAKQLLAEAGVKTPLELTMTLPPPPYARQGGEVIAAQLAKVGITVKIENVEWAQWLSQVFTGNGPQLRPDHRLARRAVRSRQLHQARLLLGYNNEAFNALYDKIKATPAEAERAKLLGDAQRCWPPTRPTASCSSRNGSPSRQEAEGPVEGSPAIRERLLRLVLGIAASRGGG